MPLVYTNLVYALIFGVAFVSSALAEIFGPAGSRAGRGYRKDQDRKSLSILNSSAGVSTILFFLLPFVFPAATITLYQPLLFALGFLLLLLGLGLRWYAMRVLGRFFVGVVVVQEEHRIVQEGPYRWVRHPAYSGILLGALGMGLMMTNWASLLAITLGMSIGLSYRIRVEEQVLREVPAYEEYQRRTRRLIPFVF